VTSAGDTLTSQVGATR